MAIDLMYITNKPDIALIAQEAGVDRIWVDLEYKGKDIRQAGRDSVKSKHSIEDIFLLRPLITKSSLMVRVNPLDDQSDWEIEEVIRAGADYIMLPMYRTKEEVERFIKLVNGRAKIILLLETAEAAENLSSYINCKGIDEIHIGLNDLHLAYKKTFMFELLTDGTVKRLASMLKEKGIKFGFGGFARIGYGMLPAEIILTHHYALGSSMAILSRGFCDANLIQDSALIKDDFILGVKNIRLKEKEVEKYSTEQFEYNYKLLSEKVDKIVEGMKDKQ